jgi:hypothetical protein
MWCNVINQEVPKNRRTPGRLAEKRSAIIADSSGSSGSMADFQPIAAGILEKDRVVARPFMIARAFDIPSARPDDDLSQPIDLAGTVRPEGDPAFVGDMP